jgi:hypothetical protein
MRQAMPHAKSEEEMDDGKVEMETGGAAAPTAPTALTTPIAGTMSAADTVAEAVHETMATMADSNAETVTEAGAETMNETVLEANSDTEATTETVPAAVKLVSKRTVLEIVNGAVVETATRTEAYATTASETIAEDAAGASGDAVVQTVDEPVNEIPNESATESDTESAAETHVESLNGTVVDTIGSMWTQVVAVNATTTAKVGCDNQTVMCSAIATVHSDGTDAAEADIRTSRNGMYVYDDPAPAARDTHKATFSRGRSKGSTSKVKSDKPESRSSSGSSMLAGAANQNASMVQLNQQLVEKKKHGQLKTVKQQGFKAKQEDDAEERFIAEYLDVGVGNSGRPLPSGHRTIPDFKTAVRNAVQESNSLVLDWTSAASYFIGRTCKVYWTLDKQWYYARILYYDSIYRKYCVRFLYIYTTAACLIFVPDLL